MFPKTLQTRLALVILSTTLFLRPALGADVPTSQPAEAWSQKLPAFWPQLVLANDASFDQHSELKGASAFLMRMPDGEILIGTAKHLIKDAGGVKPPISLPDLDRVLTRWQVYPRTREDRSIDGKGLAEDRTHETRHDWLMLHLVDAPAKLPSTPLVPRLKPAEVGETVYLVGVPYSNRNSAQIIYKGTVTARPRKNYFTYEFTPPVQIAGFSGAPIVDSNGLLVGHGVSMSAELKQKDGLEIEFGGEDAALAVQLWQHRNDPGPARPAEALHLDLPPGWTAKTSQIPQVLKYAEYTSLTAFFEMIGESKSDFEDNVDIMAWAKLVKAGSGKTSTLVNREEGDLTKQSIGGRPTVEYTITGSLRSGVKVQYRIILLELNGCFCKVICWTTPSHWDAAQPKFDEIVRAMK